VLVVFVALAWAVYLGLAWLVGVATRPRPVPADPPTPDLPDDPPPAVVGYLVNGCRLDPDAAVGTLMDLAARKYLELYQPGDDPEQTLVRVLKSDPEGLAPYERRVLDRVVEAAGQAGAVSLAELSGGYPRDGYRWSERFREEVIADAKERGLRSDRVGLVDGLVVVIGVLLACTTGFALPGEVFAAATTPEGTGLAAKAALAVGIVVTTCAFLLVLAVPVVRWFNMDQRSPAGRAVTARWLGVAAWLRAHESFTEVPPAAVAVWDRYVGYGAAMGVTPVVSRVAELVVGAREVLWSRYTGTWRQVRVRYRGRGRRSGYPPMTIVVSGLFGLGLLALLAWGVRPWFAREPVPVRYVLAGVWALLAVRWLYRIVRAAMDRLAPVTVTGEVLTKSNPPYLLDVGQAGFMSGYVRKQMTAQRQPYYLVVDDGQADNTIVWTVYPAWRKSGQCERGDLVRLQGYRWCRYARRITVERVAAPVAA
jgi:hypothetical protein